MLRSLIPLLALIFSSAIVCGSDGETSHGRATAAESADVDFARDVQPILRRHCYRCHGSKQQEADLQLNLRSSVLGDDASDSVIVRGDAQASLLIRRLVSDDDGEIMPPDSEPLSDGEVEILSRWIDEGVTWPDALSDAQHWAYRPVTRPRLPELPAAKGMRTNSPIDTFIQRRLNQLGIPPNQPSSRRQLIRRVHLALTGIPPTPDQVRRFISDPDSNAYEKVVDQLLQSPHYGERWAVPWLDLARYADSNGFQADQIRDNWAYRDWVIRAFNQDLPFDEFVIDQIAGDLRPQASIDQKIATGFHRMTTCNVEAGVHPEANRVNQVVDRVNTTATVFLGTTLECAQCHDHKYDPFSQQDYYSVFAYFNNTPLEVTNTSGVTWDFYGPKMDLPQSASESLAVDRLRRDLARIQEQRSDAVDSTDEEFEAWLAGLRQSPDIQWTPVVPASFESTGNEEFEILADGAVLLTGSVPDTVDHVFTFGPSLPPITAIRLDALTDDAIPGKGPGRGDAKRSNIILSEIRCELIGDDESISIPLQDPAADFSQPKWHVRNAIDGNRKTGWAIAPQFGKPHWASFVLGQPIVATKSDRLRVTLSQHFGRGRVIGKPRISVFTGDTTYLNLSPQIRKLASKRKLGDSAREKLRQEFNRHNPALTRLDREITRLETEIENHRPETTLVMEEMNQPRETFVMIRGDYENRGKRVHASTPAALSNRQPRVDTGDRLQFARWLTSPENPLLSRVTVNRWWGEIMGVYLVNTPEDFGAQGESPSHPDLLDWLACELMQTGWSMKHVHKQIVMSDAFQRSPAVSLESLRDDPENRSFGRGPRFRMSAELVRDNALAISGLMSSKMYGPPVMPFQPENVWRSVGRNQPKWSAAESEDRFRRGTYVVWKRAAPYPSFLNFDAPDRGNCTVGRGRSNTPLQALTLLNDPAYAEMALALADRILCEAPSADDDTRIDFATELVLARHGNEREKRLLRDLLCDERDALKHDPTLIADRTAAPIKAMSPRSTDQQELAAWFAVANALLNLDETMTQ